MSLAYIVQLNLPGGPIKIGHSSRVRQRFYQFNAGTPADCRIVGVTYPGAEREAEMLKATSSAIIKGEWRFVTPQLRALIYGWCEAGEWHEPTADPRKHYEETRVAERAIPFCRERKIDSRFGYWNAHQIAERAKDFRLLADWHGFKVSHRPPLFDWPALKAAA
jgi:hypothetical protein